MDEQQAWPKHEGAGEAEQRCHHAPRFNIKGGVTGFPQNECAWEIVVFDNASSDPVGGRIHHNLQDPQIRFE
jgi:hypothetical protein